MFLLYDHNRSIKLASGQNEDENRILIDLHLNLNKRVQLLKNFLNSKRLDKEKLFVNIVKHLDSQKKNLCKFLARNHSEKVVENSIVKQFLKHPSSNSRNFIESILQKIQNLFMYGLYLEENSFIYHVPNPNRIFSNLYYEIDIPTQLDLKAHNLLNCFGEIEVNLSNNLTSSGIIGVAATSTKKTEKQEIVQFVKKHEAFMIDANLVCVKIASIHPFIFIR